LAEQRKALPDAPGVYIFKGAQDRELYVGKAKSLRRRVAQYFDEKRPADRKTYDLVARIQSLDFVETASEVEAYLLENRLIKDLQPPFNFFNKSDINFPVVEITWNEDYPRVLVTRDRSHKGSSYYGPFVNVTWLRTALQVLQRVFQFRTCDLDIRAEDPKNSYVRPCLEFHIGRCKAPCAARQSKEEYRQALRRMARFLQGQGAEVKQDLDRDMKRAAKERRFEDAAALRDTLKALESLARRGSLEDGLEPGVLHIDPREGVTQLHEVLKLSVAPRRIEGIDIAHLQGHETVGALVSFVDGLPSREQYRRFRIRGSAAEQRAPEGEHLTHAQLRQNNDYASIAEVVTRRYTRLKEEQHEPPDLVLIDGGMGQLNAAHAALELAGLHVPFLASLSKQDEILHTLEQPTGLRLPRRSPALRLLQFVRDEAHRFAQHYHHILRRTRVTGE